MAVSRLLDKELNDEEDKRQALEADQGEVEGNTGR